MAANDALRASHRRARNVARLACVDRVASKEGTSWNIPGWRANQNDYHGSTRAASAHRVTVLILSLRPHVSKRPLSTAVLLRAKGRASFLACKDLDVEMLGIAQ